MSTPFTIPLTDVHVTEVDVAAVLAALGDGATASRVQRFEDAFAGWHDKPTAVAVSSGTAALHLALLALGVGPGDEVLVPGFTFVAVAAAVRYVGATPVLCDVVAPGEPLLDPRDAERRITARTRAIVPVHFWGYCADVAALRELCDAHGLLLVEDCAQAIGARLAGGRLAGTAGDAGCFSLFSKKQLCAGEGGVVLTRGAAAADRVRELREPDGDPGVRQALDEAHAALALSRLPRLHAAIETRRAAVRAYRERLDDLDGVTVPFDDAAVESSSHFAFTVLADDRARRDAVRAALSSRGVQTTWYPALTTLTAYAGHPALPRGEEAAARHFALPLSSSTSVEQVDAVVDALRAAVREVG